MDERLTEHLEKQHKEKEDELRSSLRKKGCPDEEIEKVLDMLNKAAHEGAEALRASRREENGGDGSAEEVDELFRKFVAEKDGQEAAGEGGD
jgi:SOS response regulatory protein OraA/RecX